MTNAIKLVPNADPNADGEWVVIQEDFDLRRADGTRWEGAFKAFVPEGFHVVAVTGSATVGHWGIGIGSKEPI